MQKRSNIWSGFLLCCIKDSSFNEFYSRPGAGEIFLMQTTGESVDDSRFLLHMLVVANL